MFNEYLEDIENRLEQKDDLSGWVRINCPACHSRGEPTEDTKRSLSVNNETGYYKCWRCELKGWRKEEHRRLLYKENARQETKCITNLRLPFNYYAFTNDAPWLAQYKEYALSRGITESTIINAKLGACMTGYWAGRLIIPFYVGGKLVGWTGRKIKEHAPGPKYLYPRGMERSNFLYLQDFIFKDSPVNSAEFVFVVEGPIDALALYPYAVATMGKASGNHSSILLSGDKNPYIAFDGDAKDAGWALSVELMLNGAQSRAINLPAGEDPASLGLLWMMANVERNFS